METEEISTELSPEEELQEFIELENLARQNRDFIAQNAVRSWRGLSTLSMERRQEIKNSLPSGQRMIQPNWEKDKITGRITFFPELSASPTASTTESSGSFVMLDVLNGTDESIIPQIREEIFKSRFYHQQ